MSLRAKYGKVQTAQIPSGVATKEDRLQVIADYRKQHGRDPDFMQLRKALTERGFTMGGK